MSFRIELIPAARGDLLAAQEWYESCQENLGRTFRVRVDEVLGRLSRNPKLCPLCIEDVRIAKVGRFPYGVVYRILEDAVVVLAVYHLRQDPGKLRRRLN